MPQSIQDLIGPENKCHGCGPENEKGHQIKSFRMGTDYVCEFMPKAHHCAGATTILNGGIIASLIDCHSVNSAMAQSYLDEGREIGSTPKNWYVTATLNISYLKPTPIDQPVKLVAKIIKTDGRKITVSCTLFSGETECVKGEVLAVRIKK